MSEESSREVNQQTGAAIPPTRGEVTDDTLREYPFIVPWTCGDYYLVRYLAGCMKAKLAAVGIAALRRGLRELAKEAVADHVRRGKPVPQRLALLARGDSTTIRSGQSEESQGEHTRC